LSLKFYRSPWLLVSVAAVSRLFSLVTCEWWTCNGYGVCDHTEATIFVVPVCENLKHKPNVNFSLSFYTLKTCFLRILFDLQSVLQKIISSLTSCLPDSSQRSSCQPILCYDSCVCSVHVFPSANRTDHIRIHVCKQNTRSGSGICNIWTVAHTWNTSWNKYMFKKYR
jgi:hypothetical protein